MRVLTTGILLIAAAAGPAACGAPASAPAYDLSASIEDIMIGVMEPSADAIFQSVAVVSSAAGVENRAPQTDEQWARVEHAALTLAEAANLIRMPGRAVVRGSGNPPETAAIPELTPAEIRQRIDADRERWDRLAAALNVEARRALQFARDRSVAGLFDVGGPIDEACENCHVVYWFPNAPQAPGEP
jgi:hypothetical protein